MFTVPARPMPDGGAVLAWLATSVGIAVVAAALPALRIGGQVDGVRNAEGKVLVHHAVQGAKEGSYVGEVYAEGDELFVFVDHALHRVSLETGAERPPIMWL